MTIEEARRNQDRLLSDGFSISFWYGTRCEKCCGVFPKAMKKDGNDPKDFYYQCEVCGKRTDTYTMPHLAEKAWNEHRYKEEYHQLSFV